MLYKKNNTNELDTKLFENPTSEYRGTPFWAWNCKLNKQTLMEQIGYLKEMGFGGFHIHSRSGMATEYLSENFFDLIKDCVKKAKDENMLAWLYDEDRWPSGAAGGYATENISYREKFLELTTVEDSDAIEGENNILNGITSLLACYDIILNEKGELLSYSKIDKTTAASGVKWYAYIKNNAPTGWFNNHCYLDTMSKEAVDKFIQITHEAYKKHVGNEFGNTIPAIFSDEPHFSDTKIKSHSLDGKSARIPWTVGLGTLYREKYMIDLIEHLPELFWELPNDKTSQARYYFHDLTCELFATNYMDNISDWCQKNNILYTGHVLEEQSLMAQTKVVGEAMRCYRSMGIPGIDMLCDAMEFSTAKQAQSVVHQYGRDAMMSELYGVTNWDFDFRGHKFQGDWQAALGVTVRVPHLSWVSMKGFAKRDYPASINYQSPWYKEYSNIENHFARLNTVLTRGKPIVNVGVIHPIESCWLHYGPSDLTSDIQSNLENKFQELIRWLLLGTIDFDFISESLLADIGLCKDNKLTVGEMQYSSIIVCGCETLRKSTLRYLKEFHKNGGRLIFSGNCPKYIDAKENDEIVTLYNEAIKVDVDKISVLDSLKSERFISITNPDGSANNNMIYTLREDTDCNWLFIAHGKKYLNTKTSPIQLTSIDIPEAEMLTITLNGEFIPMLYDTLSGNISDIPCEYLNGKTIISANIYCMDSLLLKLKSGKRKSAEIPQKVYTEIKRIDYKTPVDFSIDEPNVLLLDMAEYKLDDEEFNPIEEVLRIDKKCRIPLGFPQADGCDCQPWCIKDEQITHFITLRFNIESEINVKNPQLAIEEVTEIVLNGKQINTVPCGYYVDKDIKTYILPEIIKGINTLTVKVPFGKRTGIESCYLIGDFGVSVIGAVKKIISLPKTLGFGTSTTQGLPFYGGNICYTTEFIAEESCCVKINASHYRGALIKVILDDKDIGRIICPPYTLVAENINKGKHTVKFILYGNRVNTFGSLHNHSNNIWYGPVHWYAENDRGWSYEYNLRENGILSSPVITLCKTNEHIGQIG